MKIKTSLSIIFSSFIFSLLLLFIFLVFIDPLQAGIFGLILFFLTFFLLLLSLFTLIFIILRLRKVGDGTKIFEGFSPAFRRAIFLSLFLNMIFLFKFLGVLFWWNVALSLLLFVLLEIIFSRRKEKLVYLDKKDAV